MPKVYLLGQHRVVADDGGGPGSAPARALQLLAYLALRPGTEVPRQHLAEMLWPDSPEAQALTNPRRELHTLRGLLGGGAAGAGLHGCRTTLCWAEAPGQSVDVARFRTEHDAALRQPSEGTDALLAHADAALEAYRASCCRGTPRTGWSVNAGCCAANACSCATAPPPPAAPPWPPSTAAPKPSTANSGSAPTRPRWRCGRPWSAIRRSRPESRPKRCTNGAPVPRVP